MMAMPSDSPAMRAVLRWLVGGGHLAIPAALYEYYKRSWSVEPVGAYRAGLVGASVRMCHRLEAAGYVADGRVTKAGKRAAQ